MSQIALSGNAAGTASFEIQAPATNTNRTITLPDTSGQMSVLDLRAAQTASGTNVDFQNIPATARRITVMFEGVSLSGTSQILIQIGASGGLENTGYLSTALRMSSSAGVAFSSTAGFIVGVDGAAFITSGQMLLTHMGSNKWVESLNAKINTSQITSGGGDKTLSGALDRIRITTVNGTDQFDAGSIAILVE